MTNENQKNQKSELKTLANKITNSYEDLIEHFDLDLKDKGAKWVGCCPVHGGDNKIAFHLQKSGGWKCYTHQCHESFYGTSLGLLRGLLSNSKLGWGGGNDTQYGWRETLKYADDFLEGKAVPDKLIFSPKKRIEAPTYSLDDLGNLVTPCPYMCKKFSEKVVSSMKIGYCGQPGKKQRGRSVVPVFDKDKIVGLLGRSIYRKCDTCEGYHQEGKCPDYFSPKWKSSVGFATDRFLYNANNIKRAETIFVVESIGNTLRMLDFKFKNTVATFGTQFSKWQRELLLSKGAKRVVFIKDYGGGGDVARDIAKNALKNDVEFICPEFYYSDDIASVTPNEFKKYIKPKLEEYK